jgi:hypothetical protein
VIPITRLRMVIPRVATHGKLDQKNGRIRTLLLVDWATRSRAPAKPKRKDSAAPTGVISKKLEKAMENAKDESAEDAKKPRPSVMPRLRPKPSAAARPH